MNQAKLRPDHRAILEGMITELEGEAPNLTRKERIKMVEQITDSYTLDLGYRIDSHLLTRMADIILREELTDSHPDKMSRKEFPIMSEHQLMRRTQGKQRHRNSVGNVIVEVPLEHAVNVGTDGINHTLPTRKYAKGSPV